MRMSIEPESDAVVGLDACPTRLVDPERVTSVRERLVDRDEARRLAEQFKLLGDPTRARLLYALLEAGELCVCDLAETIGVPESSVSPALRLLRTAGPVRNRRDGRVIYSSLDASPVRPPPALSPAPRPHAERDPPARQQRHCA